METEKAYLWRLVDCYRRAAIGELCAMIFLPLLVLGLYLLVDGKSSELDREASVVKSKRMLLSLKDGNSTQIILYLVIGMTGLLQTHIITLLLTILTVLVILIFRWKDVFHLDKICILAISGITTLVINMWFIVPFVDYYINFPMAVSNGEETVLSSRALNLFDLLTVFQPWGKGKRLKYTYV